MSSIDFFTPVAYKSQNKTISQKVLEAVDEYFYLGGKFRVNILAPNAEHTRFWAMQNRQDCHRSWKNIAAKVASYITLILPLIALLVKAGLRCSLQISSIQVHSRVISKMEAKLPIVMLQHIGSFLSYRDQGNLAQVATFANKAALNKQQYYVKRMGSLKSEIDALPSAPLARKDFQRLLIGLISSPAIGHPKHWVPLMDALIRRCAFDDDTVSGVIQSHADMAHLLSTSGEAISSEQMYQFCRYLERGQLSQFKPWISYRALEQYLLKPTLNFPCITEVLREHLTKRAKIHMRPENNGAYFSDRQTLKYQEVDIDPRKWFGSNGSNDSLWVQPQNPATAPMPELVLEVLWTRIQSLRDACVDRPFMVSMIGRLEAQLPHNFTLELAERITNAGIFLYHNHTINPQDLENPHYAHSICLSSNEELEALAQRYPAAVMPRD